MVTFYIIYVHMSLSLNVLDFSIKKAVIRLLFIKNNPYIWGTQL